MAVHLRTFRWPGTAPDADPSRRAVVLPGRAYPVEMPGLWAPMRALALDGWDVWCAAWDLGDLERSRWGGAVERALAEVGDGAGLVVGKSLGSLAAGWAADRAVPGVWLTPLLTDPGVVAGISRSSAPQLLVAGTEDHTWDDAAAAQSGAEVVRLGAVDHGFLCGDLTAEIAVLGQVADAVRGFARQVSAAG